MSPSRSPRPVSPSRGVADSNPPDPSNPPSPGFERRIAKPASRVHPKEPRPTIVTGSGSRRSPSQTTSLPAAAGINQEKPMLRKLFFGAASLVALTIGPAQAQDMKEF